MNVFISAVLWGVGGAVALLALAMVAHLVVRSVVRSRAERQREIDGVVLASLQSGAQADELVLRLARIAPDYARRGLVHGLRTLGESYLTYVAYVYDRLNFGPRALRDLRSYRWIRRAEAALELGAFRRAEAVADCLSLLRDPVAEVRMAAARALGDIAAPGTIRPILEAIPVCTRWAVTDAVDLVRGFGDAAAPELLATLAESTVRQARLASIEALGEMAHAAAVPAIDPFLADPDLEFRAAATRAIGRLGGHGVFAALGRALKAPAWQVRAVAARALGAYRNPEASALLEMAMNDAAWWVRLNAAEALAQQDAQGAEALRRTLTSTDSFARELAAQMLQNIQPGGATA